MYKNFMEASAGLWADGLDWDCFPCGSDKKPQCKWKEEAKPPMMWPDVVNGASYLGIVCGPKNGLLVIDLDVKDGIDGYKAFKEWLEQAEVKLPDNIPIARTRSGGYHLYFKYPEGSGISIGQDLFGLRGVDWRGDGGYIIHYGLEWGSFGFIPELPDRLLQEIQAYKPAKKKAESLNKLDDKGRLVDGRDELARNLAFKLVMRKADEYNSWPEQASYPELLAELVDEYKKLASFDSDDDSRNEVFLKEKLDYALHNCRAKWEKKKLRTSSEASSLSYELAGSIKLDSHSRYLVKGLLNVGSLSVVYGPPACGKSFFVIDLAYSVALGLEYNGSRVKGGSVLYCALEGSTGVKNRLIAQREDKGVADNFFVCSTSFSMFTEEGKDQVFDLIDKIESDGREKPSLIIIDTLARTMAPGSENAVEDMGQLVKHLDELKEETGAHVMLVHHTGKDKARGARGSNALLGAVDTELSIEESGGVRCLKATKQKDMDLGSPAYFKLVPTELGFDEDGDEITTCLVQYLEADDDAIAKFKSKEYLSPVHQIAVKLLKDLWEAKYPPGSPLFSAVDGYGVECDKWFKMCEGAGLMDDVEDGYKRFVAIRNKLVVSGWCELSDGKAILKNPAIHGNEYNEFKEAG